jgi:hypothetical protein
MGTFSAGLSLADDVTYFTNKTRQCSVTYYTWFGFVDNATYCPFLIWWTMSLNVYLF